MRAADSEVQKVRLELEESAHGQCKSTASTSVVKSGQIKKCKESVIEGIKEKKVCVRGLQGGKEGASGEAAPENATCSVLELCCAPATLTHAFRARGLGD